MVQRKEPTKLKPKKTSKQASPKPESFVGLHGRSSPMSKGAAAASSSSSTMNHLPNYMRPTTSSDARRDHYHHHHHHHVQVTQITSSPSVSNSGRRKSSSMAKSSSSPPSVTSKRKPLTLTPFLKRSKSKVLFPKLGINRATCASTLKDSKFPNALDLTPGGTESEGTSAVRVCPYTYCSLNGHVHEPVPPLKTFLASKRRLIKTQQSMKLKGFSPFRKREPKRSEKEASPLFQEVVNDFIVEIYAGTNETVVDPMRTEERTVVVECENGRRREEEEVASTGNLDQKSEFSAEEMDAVVKLVEYVSCDREIEESREKCSDLGEEEPGEEVNFDEKCAKFESFKEFDADVFSDSGSFSSERTDAGSDRSHEHLFALKGRSDVEEDMDTSVSSESEFQNQTAVGTDTDEGVGEAKENLEVNSNAAVEESGDCTDSEVVSEREDNGIPSHLITDKNLDVVVDLNDKVNSTESEVVPERGDEKRSEIETSDISENGTAFPVLESIDQECEEVEEKGQEQDVNIQKVDTVIEVEEEVYRKEEETEISGTELDRDNEEQSNSKDPEQEVNVTGTREDDESTERVGRDEPKEEEAVATASSQMDQLCVAFDKMRIEGEDYSFDPTCRQKNRLIIARRRPRSGEDDYTRGFNPRAPNFLPLEPDPESEKVDLRHQMMDERKNAEEYLLDYALQKAVNQLAPARKKKVELLVAAFETVVPVVPV